MATTTVPPPLTSVNLRHHRSLSEIELRQLPSGLDRLWIGPSFDSSLTTVCSIVESLPPQLSDLDLDMTQLASRGGVVVASDASHPRQQTDDFITKECVSRLFKRIHTLRSLSLRLPQGIGDRGAIALASTLGQAQCLTLLDLRECRIQDPGLVALSKALQSSSIRGLIISWSTVTPMGIGALAAALRNDPPLESLNLSCADGVDDESIRQLVSGLRENSTLLELSLFCCSSIGEASGRLLLQCLQGGGDEGSSHYCNTTLERINLKGTKVPKCYQVQIEYYLQLNRAGRKFVINYSEDRNERKRRPHQRQLALSLWPYILAKHARRRDGTECRSSLFQTSSTTACLDRQTSIASISSSVTGADISYYFLRNKADLVLHGS